MYVGYLGSSAAIFAALLAAFPTQTRSLLPRIPVRAMKSFDVSIPTHCFSTNSVFG